MKGITVFSLFIYLYLLQQTEEAFMNDTNINCCLNYDYVADGTAAGCGTPTGDRMKGSLFNIVITSTNNKHSD